MHKEDKSVLTIENDLNPVLSHLILVLQLYKLAFVHLECVFGMFRVGGIPEKTSGHFLCSLRVAIAEIVLVQYIS